MTEADTIFKVDRTRLVFRMIRWMRENPLWMSSESVSLERKLELSGRPQVSYIIWAVFALLVFYPFLVPLLFPSYIFFGILEIWGPLKRYDAQQTSLLLGLFSWSVVLTYKAVVGGLSHGWLGDAPRILKITQVLAFVVDVVSAVFMIILLIELITLLVRKYRMITGRTSVQFRG